MLITSICGIVINIIMVFLRHICQSHGGGDVEQGQRDGKENINVTAAILPVVGDLLQSVGVLIAAIVIYLKPDWVIVDPICTLLCSVLLLWPTGERLRNVVDVFMEATPPGVSYSNVVETLKHVPGILAVHNLHIWRLTNGKIVMNAHLVIDPNDEGREEEVRRDATLSIRKHYNLFEMAFQVESHEPDMDTCGDCKELKKTE